MIKKINFPAEEIAELKNKNQLVTTRVSQEYNRYHIGEILQSPWKQRYIVINTQKIKHIQDHPYYAELTKEQIKLISKYKRINVITLKKYLP